MIFKEFYVIIIIIIIINNKILLSSRSVDLANKKLNFVRQQIRLFVELLNFLKTNLVLWRTYPTGLQLHAQEGWRS